MGQKSCLGSTAAELASGDGRRFVVGGPLLGSSSRTDPEAFFTGVKGDHEFGWVPSNGGGGGGCTWVDRWATWASLWLWWRFRCREGRGLSAGGPTPPENGPEHGEPI